MSIITIESSVNSQIKIPTISIAAVKMETIKENDRRKVIGDFYSNHRNSGKSFTVKHFQQMGVARSTIYNIIRRVENEETLERSAGSGRKARKMKERKRQQLEEVAIGKIGQSYRKLGRKFKISHEYVRKILKDRNVVLRKRKSAPKYSIKQLQTQKKLLRNLRESYLKPSDDRFVILDDETYFTLDGADCAGNSSYYYKEGVELDPEVKFKRHTKFPKKILVWLAFSARGRSAAYIAPSGLSVNQDIYAKECIQKRLVPFIEKYHNDGRYVFWPDMATSHYARGTIEVYERYNISFIPRSENVPNVPQLRPIERFWYQLKQKVYENGWEAKDLAALKTRIQAKLRQFDVGHFERLMARLKTKVRQAADYGPDYIISH